MEINKKFLISSIGATIVVIAGGVYANVRAINSIKKDIKAIKAKQSDTMYAVDCLTKSDTLQNQINNNDTYKPYRSDAWFKLIVKETSIQSRYSR